MARLFRRLPGWVWRVGMALVVGGYIWAFYAIFVSPFGFRWRALYGDMAMPDGYDIHGIDVSHYQGDIDWKKLRHQGTIDHCPVSFVMIKATEGADKVDDKFDYNFTQAREHGLTRGAYHYYSTQSEAADQARFFFQNVKLEQGDLPPVLDVEQKPKGQNVDAFRHDVLQWLRMAEHHYGVKPILYTYYKFKIDYLNDSVFNDYPYWIAHYYVDKLKYRGQWTFWQYTDVGHVSGIGSRQEDVVDCNIFNGTLQELLDLTIREEQLDNIEQ
jgi:lysozyme